LSTVTTRAILSHGTINFRFKSKEFLFVETLRYLAEEHCDHWRAALKTAGSRPEKQLAAMIEIDFDPAICNETRFAVWGGTRCHPAYLGILGRIDAERLRELERVCRSIKEEGQNPHVGLSLVAKSLEPLIDGIWLDKLCQPNVDPRSEARRMCGSLSCGAVSPPFSAE
jgi:TetR/AcrR family transcriptional repressor of bet genes